MKGRVLFHLQIKQFKDIMYSFVNRGKGKWTGFIAQLAIHGFNFVVDVNGLFKVFHPFGIVGENFFPGRGKKNKVIIIYF
jgi:hypothetical protein